MSWKTILGVVIGICLVLAIFAIWNPTNVETPAGALSFNFFSNNNRAQQMNNNRGVVINNPIVTPRGAAVVSPCETGVFKSEILGRNITDEYSGKTIIMRYYLPNEYRIYVQIDDQERWLNVSYTWTVNGLNLCYLGAFNSYHRFRLSGANYSAMLAQIPSQQRAEEEYLCTTTNNTRYAREDETIYYSGGRRLVVYNIHSSGLQLSYATNDNSTIRNARLNEIFQMGNLSVCVRRIDLFPSDRKGALFAIGN